MAEWLEDAEPTAALVNRLRGTSALDPRRQALKRLEGAVSEVRFRLMAQPEEAVAYCRHLLVELAENDKLSGMALEEKWQRRRDALEMTLTNFLADGLVELGQWEEAASTYERCLSLGALFQVPEFQADSFLKLGQAYRHAGKLDDARHAFERTDMLAQLYGLHAADAEALYQQAVIAELQNRPQDAFMLYESGLRLSQTQSLPALSIRFLSQLGQLYQSEGQYLAALHNYQRCLQLLRETDNDPESEIIILGQISHICVELKDFETGVEAAREGLALSVQAGQSAEEETFLTDLARLYGRLGDYGQARAYARQARDRAVRANNRTNIEAADRLLAKIEQLERQPSTAQTGSFDLSGLSQQTATIYYRRANRYYQKGSLDRAISAYSRALHIDPAHLSAYINRGSTYAAQGDYDRALADYSKAIELNPTDQVIFFNRGNTYRKRREYDRALADYTEAIRLDPTDPDARFNRGEVLRRLNRQPEAIADFQRVLELSAGRDEVGAQQARQMLREMQS